MTRITKVLAVPTTGAHYSEDLSAMKLARATPGGAVLRGVNEAIAVGLVLDNGLVAWGDCVESARRDRVCPPSAFGAAEGIDTIQRVVSPALANRALSSFRELDSEIDQLVELVQETRPLSTSEGTVAPEAKDNVDVADVSRRALFTRAARLLSPFPDEEADDRTIGAAPEPSAIPVEHIMVERRLRSAVRYGVSQALLKAMSLAHGITMAEVVAEEWGLPLPDSPVPIHALSGPERYLSADKMIIRRVASLPDAPVHSIAEQIGDDGSKLSGYVRWLVDRIQELADQDYEPTIHLDLNGALGQLFDYDMGKVLGQLYATEFAAQPYRLRVANPVIMDSRDEQIQALKTLRGYMRFRKMNVQLVADKWVGSSDDIQAFLDGEAADMLHIKMPDLGGLHNSVEAVIACKGNGVGAYLGGGPGETDVAARVAVHVALATRPDLLMAKPGIGVDEAISVVCNEMARSLISIRARGG